MSRGIVAMVGVIATLVMAPSAWATTQTARSGDVTATFTFHGKYPNYNGEKLSISQSGNVLYSQPVHSSFCGTYCAPTATLTKSSSVHLVDLDDIGQPNVILDLYSGGAHCCFIEQVFTFDPGTMTYSMAQHDFGDPGESIEDLNHNRHYEFVTEDDSFAYAFTDFAASGLPLQILSFQNGQFINITRQYPAMIKRDAANFLKYFKGAGKGYRDTTGLIAAWAADEYELGRAAQADRYLNQQAALGHLNSPLAPVVPQNAKFVKALEKFLKKHGYG
jgi:hypothetical protein